MPVRFKQSEGWVFDTTEEAVAFYRQINGVNGAANTVARPRPVERPEPEDVAVVTLTESAKKLIRLLLDHPEGMSGRALATQVGVEPKGVGSVMATISRWGESHGLTRKEMIIKKRERDASTTKIVRILKLTGAFRRKIMGGQFAELLK